MYYVHTVQTSEKVNISYKLSAGVLHPARSQVASWPWILCRQSAVTTPACTRGSTHAGDGNQFIGVVELPKGAIVELEFSIDK